MEKVMSACRAASAAMSLAGSMANRDEGEEEDLQETVVANDPNVLAQIEANVNDFARILCGEGTEGERMRQSIFANAQGGQPAAVLAAAVAAAVSSSLGNPSLFSASPLTSSLSSAALTLAPGQGALSPQKKRKRQQTKPVARKKSSDAVRPQRNKRCQCPVGAGQVQAYLGHPGEGLKWCVKCKPANHNIKNACECGRTKARFGLQEQRAQATKLNSVLKWCSKCPNKPKQAVDLTAKRCECGLKQASIGLPGETRRQVRWCASCPNKPPEAVCHIRGSHKKPCACGTNMRPRFGLRGETPKWCAKCPTKPPAAINLCCKRCQCGAAQPTFLMPGDKAKDARWCASCKPVGAVSRRTLKP